MKIEKIVTGALEENCYVISFEGTCLIVDPGSDFTKIKKAVGTNKILGILVTHVHFDHIGALRDFLNENRRLKVYKKSNLADNQTLTIGAFTCQVLYTPGHSSDSISFYFEQEKCMFTGDFLFKDTIGRCDLPTGDEKMMIVSLEKIKQYPDDITLYPGHGDTTTLAKEKKDNLYLQKETFQ